MKPSERHRLDADALVEFRNAYVELINAAKPHQPMFITKLGPGVSMTEWNRLRSAVAQAAGAAMPAYRRDGSLMSLRNPAQIMHGLSPVENWEMSLSDPAQLPSESVLASVESAYALARSKYGEALEREKGLVGFIAAFLRWPSTLREAVGPDHAAQRTAAGVLGVVGQIVVGIIAGLLTSGLIAGGVALWQELAS